MRSVFSLNQRITLQQKKNSQLLTTNILLEQEINSLQQDPIQDSSLIEDYMRWKLELVKEGEWFCRW